MTTASAVSADDQILIVAIAMGDGDALTMLHGRYAAAAKRVALRYLHDQDLANEIVQELFWRVWRHAKTVAATGGPVAAWIFTIVRRLCIDMLRHLNAHPVISLEAATRDGTWQLVDMRSDVVDVAIAGDQARALTRALHALTAAEQQAITLIYFRGLTFQETAQQLSLPVGTTKSRVHRGLRKLRALLGTQMVTAEGHVSGSCE